MDDHNRRAGERSQQRARFERQGARRFRPGPGSSMYAPRMAGTGRQFDAGQVLDREIDLIGAGGRQRRARSTRRELARLVGARYWGPGRFRQALAEAMLEGRVQRISRTIVGPPTGR